MDFNQRQEAIQRRSAIVELTRALNHLTSDDFLSLPEDQRIAHAEGYRSRLQILDARLPQHPYFMSDLILLRIHLQIYE